MIQSDTEVSCERFPRRGGERDTPTLAPRYALLSAGCWIWQQILLDIDMWEDGTDHVLYPWCFHVWWDVADPPCPTAWHSEGYVHKGWTLFFLAWTVPAHIHLIVLERNYIWVKYLWLLRWSADIIGINCMYSLEVNFDKEESSKWERTKIEVTMRTHIKIQYRMFLLLFLFALFKHRYII